MLFRWWVIKFCVISPPPLFFASQFRVWIPLLHPGIAFSQCANSAESRHGGVGGGLGSPLAFPQTQKLGFLMISPYLLDFCPVFLLIFSPLETADFFMLFKPLGDNYYAAQIPLINVVLNKSCERDYFWNLWDTELFKDCLRTIQLYFFFSAAKCYDKNCGLIIKNLWIWDLRTGTPMEFTDSQLWNKPKNLLIINLQILIKKCIAHLF